MTQFSFYFLFIIGLIFIIANIINSKDAGKLRTNCHYQSAPYYIADTLLGVMLVLIAFGVV